MRTAIPKFCERIRKALLLAEIPDCGCQTYLMPSCLKGQAWGCSTFRADGCCDCKIRRLPRCQNDHVGGCEDRRRGKRCRCALAEMPECLSPGCKRRRSGKICDSRFCSKWPGEPCQHIRAATATMLAAVYSLNVFGCDSPESPDEGWYYYLVRSDPNEFRPVRFTPSPMDLTHRATRIAILRERVNRGEALWHPADTLYASTDVQPRRLAKRIQEFISLARQQ